MPLPARPPSSCISHGPAVRSTGHAHRSASVCIGRVLVDRLNTLNNYLTWRERLSLPLSPSISPSSRLLSCPNCLGALTVKGGPLYLGGSGNCDDGHVTGLGPLSWALGEDRPCTLAVIEIVACLKVSVIQGAGNVCWLTEHTWETMPCEVKYGGVRRWLADLGVGKGTWGEKRIV
jgi:hypothetical protein